MNRQTRMIKEQKQTRAYLAGKSDYLGCTAVVVYGEFNISPPQSALDIWGSQYNLYIKGWEAAKRL